jgi:prevent-host-death family protein
MISTGIRDLKNNLSHYVRQIEAGKRVAVTAHGRVVAELVPPSQVAKPSGMSRYDELVAAGLIEQAAEPDIPVQAWPKIQLPSGTVTHLIDIDRDEP